MHLLSPSGWLARLRYNRRIKRLNRPLGSSESSIDANLIRAGKIKHKEAAIRKMTDVRRYPFSFPTTGSQGHKRYVLYDSFYCIFPSTVSGVESDILMTYTSWLSRTKTEYPLPNSVSEYLAREGRAIVHVDTVHAMNHFLIANKFSFGGHVLNADEDGYVSVSLIYYRTQPVSTEGIIVDPNLFFLKEAQKDSTTSCRISDQWSGDVADAVASAQVGVDTDIEHVPLDKCLYVAVTAYLKAGFQVKSSHMVVD